MNKLIGGLMFVFGLHLFPAFFILCLAVSPDPPNGERVIVSAISALCVSVFVCGFGVYMLYEDNKSNPPGQKTKQSD